MYFIWSEYVLNKRFIVYLNNSGTYCTSTMYSVGISLQLRENTRFSILNTWRLSYAYVLSNGSMQMKPNYTGTGDLALLPAVGIRSIIHTQHTAGQFATSDPCGRRITHPRRCLAYPLLKIANKYFIPRALPSKYSR